MKLQVLDCTFRDGGYYNKWDFNPVLVRKYLSTIHNAGVNVVELGFRNLPKEAFFGAFAYTTDTYINSLNIDSKISIGVMINADSVLHNNLSVKDVINVLFQPKVKSRVDLVRIATHFDLIDQCEEIANELKRIGYQVGLNLMQVHSKSDNELFSAVKSIESWNNIDILYFADSLGGMSDNDVIRVISILKSNWTGKIGFHAHNNKGLAVSNTLTAIRHGAEWVDCTVLGMGRGAGNAQTENLLLELNQRYNTAYHPSALFNLVLSDFSPLQIRYHWGESLLYNLAAMHNIHPTYIQELLTDNRYSNKEILQAIKFMSSLDASHYDKNLLLQAHGDDKNPGSWNAKDWCKGKSVLILGSGAGLITYQQGIEQYIQTHQPVVISLNIQHNFPQDLIDVYVSSNESKMLSEFALYTELDKPLAISSILLKKVLGKSLAVQDLWDYGLNIRKNMFVINETECTIPYELSVGYALSLANVGGAQYIGLVGFDGYHGDDIRQTKMNELLSLYHQHSEIPVVALTPSTYDLRQGSIYAGEGGDHHAM